MVCEYVCDAINSLLENEGEGKDSKAVHKIKVSREMLKYCRDARMKYDRYLDEAKVSERNTEELAEQKSLNDEVLGEKKKLANCERSIKRLITEADKLSCRAEKEVNLSLLKDSNINRKRAAELGNNAEESRSKIRKMEGMLK